MGLGLSLVKKIITSYKHIWVEDNVKGNSAKGSIFIILIPEVIAKIDFCIRLRLKIFFAKVFMNKYLKTFTYIKINSIDAIISIERL